MWLFISLITCVCPALTACIIANFTCSNDHHFIQKFLVMDAWGSQLCSKALIPVVCCFKPQSAWSCNWFMTGKFPLQIKSRNISVTPSLIPQSLNLCHRPRIIPLHQGYYLYYRELLLAQSKLHPLQKHYHFLPPLSLSLPSPASQHNFKKAAGILDYFLYIVCFSSSFTHTYQ